MSQDFETMLCYPKCDIFGHLYVQVWPLTLTRDQTFNLKSQKRQKRARSIAQNCTIISTAHYNTVALQPFGFYLPSYFSSNLHVGGRTVYRQTKSILWILSNKKPVLTERKLILFLSIFGSQFVSQQKYPSQPNAKIQLHPN